MKRKKTAALRKFGLELVGNVPWGTHLCQFYETKEDLVNILVPYFTEGLRNNEFCMWITSPPLEAEEAKHALKRSVPELDQYIQKGQIEILPYTEWYLLGGSFNSDRVLRDWVKKEKAAFDSGFDGLRLTGNTFWLERNGWKAFTEYEEQINNTIGKHKMIAVCTYCLGKCNSNEVIDVVKNHQFALIKRSGKWELIESSETKKVQRALLSSEKKFSVLYSSMIEGVAFHNVVYDSSGKAVDYVITDVNPAFEKITGLPKKQVIGKRASELYGTGEPPYLEVFAKVASSGKAATFETYFPPMQKHFSISVFSPSKGKFTTVFHDITQHRQAEEALRNVALFPEQNPFPILRVTRDGNLLYANKSSKCLLDLWGCQNAQRVPEQVRQQVAQALDTQQIAQFEVICCSATYSFIIAPITQFDYANLYGRDITEHKRAEEALQRAKRDWERTFDSVPDFIAILDNQHRIMRVNRAMAHRLGMTPERCIGLRCFEVVHGASQPLEFCPCTLTLRDGQEHIAEVYEDRLGGLFLVSTTPLRDEQERMVGSVHVARNITERKKAEEALRESQHDLNRAQAVAKTGSWRLDVQRNELLWSDETHRMFGIPKGTPLTYETFLGTVHPDDREYVDREWKTSLRGEHYDIEHRIVVNREVKWVREKAELEFDKNGTLLGGFGTVQDITERKRTEQELFDTLRESQRRQSEISALLKSSKTVFQIREFMVSARTIFDSCKELLGAAAGYVALLSGDGKNNAVLFLESGGLPCSVDPSLPMPVRGLRAETYSTGKVVIENSFPKNKWSKLLPSGHVGLENVLFAPLTVDGRTVGVIGLANKPGGFTERDAQMALAFGELASIALINSEMLEMLEENAKKLKTQSEHLEELVEERTRQLKDAERLAAIGQTAGMVGHDMRNPLQSILGDVYLAKMDLASLPDSEEKEGLQESLDAIEKQTEYINKIVLDLQDFAKPLNPHAEETDIEIIINELLTKNGVPKNIQTDAKVDVDAKTMMADSAYMKRILGNLVSNAVQAMPNGGKLTIHAYREASDIVITVEDTGVGIPEEAKPKLFQPLFTTKSKGQGFGLSVVKRLTEALNGTITFESQEGKGTKFALRFPSPR